LFEEFTGGSEFPFAAMEFGKGDESGELFFNAIHSAGAGECVLKPFRGGVEIIQTECGSAVETGGANEVGFNTLNFGQLRGALSEGESTFGISEREETLGQESATHAFELLVVLSDKDNQRSLAGNFGLAANSGEGEAKANLGETSCFVKFCFFLPGELESFARCRLRLAQCG
jgi:hypothetical protein